MSLVDALLLEPYRDPREVYIALRSDGLKGSGTIDDPYDGATRLGPELQASLTFEGRKFVLGTPFAHGLSVNDVVTITNVHGPAAAWFNKKFKVLEKLSDLHVMLSFDDLAVGETAVPSASPVRPPAPPGVPYSYIGVIYVNYTPGTNNKNALPAGARLYWPVARMTVPSNHGLKVFDAVTVGNVSPIDYQGDYPIFGPLNPTATVFAYRLSFLPPSDFTTPLNCTVTRRIHRYDEVMRAAPFPSVIHLGSGTFETRGYASVYVANNPDFTQLHTGYILRSGQRLLGSGIGPTTLKLVLPVDEYNQTTAVGNPSYPNASYAEVADLTIDCNAAGHAAPYGIFPAPVTCGAVGLGGSFICVRRVRAIHFCVQALPECFPIYLGPSSQGGVPTFNVIEDCILEKPGENNTHETSLILNGGNARSPVVRHTFSDCHYANGVSSELLWIDTIEYAPADTEALVTLKRSHHRTALINNAVLANVRRKIFNDLGQQIGEIPTVFDGTFPITDVVSALQFKILKPAGAPPSNELSYVSDYDSIRAVFGVDFHAPIANFGTGCVAEGNAAFDCLNAFYSDTGSSRDTVVRDNYYSNTGLGVYMNFPPDTFDAFRGASSITLIQTTPKRLARFTTLQAHGLSPGASITIREAGAAGADSLNPYHGVVSVQTDPLGAQANSFVYELRADAPYTPSDNCPGRPVFRPSVAASTFAFASTGEVTVVTAADHGLVAGDFVTFAGVTPSSVPSPPPPGVTYASYNGLWGPITPDPTDTKKFTFTLLDPVYHPLPATGTGGTMDRHMAAGVVRNGTVATVTTVSPHGYFLGQVFKMQGARVNSSVDNGYNGVVTVKLAMERSFTYDMKPVAGSVPGGSASPTGPVAYAAHWDNRHFVLENNTYDLYATDANTGTFPRGVSMFGLSQADIPPYIFPNLVYRGNIIRHIDGRLPVAAAPATYGIYATTIGNGIVEQNIIDVSAAYPLTYKLSGNFTHLQNKTSGGTLIKGFNETANKTIDDIETRIADALSMALL